MMKRSLAILAVLAAAAASATASSAALTPAQAAAQAKSEWLKEMQASATSGDRAARFPSPSRAILMQRLRRAQRQFYPLFDRPAMKSRCGAVCPSGFQIASVRMLHPLQAAPVIVIRSDREHEIARAIPSIVNLFDPRHPTSANPSGYAYEGYFLVAETSRGVPYLATFNHWRAPHVGGGEWAVSESLYPFPHG
jgi:hypothetical protein